MFFICALFLFHGTIIGAEVYSNPSVIIASKTHVTNIIHNNSAEFITIKINSLSPERSVS